MANGFTFNGKSTSDFPNMQVEKYPGTKGAVRKYESFSIPGRNGDLHAVQEAFENTTQSYECYYRGDGPTNEEAHAVRRWLQASVGYQRLEDVYDRDHFRLAMVRGGVDIENKLNKYGRFTVTFNCDPRFFLKSGEEPIILTEQSSNLENFTDCPARPLIKVYGTGAAWLNINGLTINIKDISEHIVLDCEMLNAYKYHTEDVLENKNGDISAADFPTLKPGNNLIQFGGEITHIEIIPRWWTL